MSEAASAPALPEPPGPRLKLEREKRGMSAQKAADELHLDTWVIEALESGDYRRIGPTVYAKGHLKRYAGLLSLPTAEIMAGYETQVQAPLAAGAAPAGTRLSAMVDGPTLSNVSPGRMLGGVVLVLVLVGVLWWKPWHQRASTAAVAAPPAVAIEAAESAQDGQATDDASAAAPPVMAREALPAAKTPTNTPASSRANSQVNTSASTPASTSLRSPVAASIPATSNSDPAAAAAAMAGAGRARLRLSFSADSWVDVHDALGKRAFAGNGLANSVKTIAGVAPMRVYLGAANGVQLEINDRAVAIGPQFFAGEVARFEAGADGVLRRDQAHAAATGAASSTAQTRNVHPPG
jgi:cytoskeleton protein RodZ